jgi:ABC-2 type transport system ATP-binding protein
MIQVQALTKYFGEHAAVRDLSFTIQQGELVGFLGLNGAGKTTTLRMLASLLLPTAGTVTVDGIEVTQDPFAIRRRIGYLPDVPPLHPEMTVGDFLRFAARLREVPAKHADARVAEAEEKTALREVHDAPIASLSHGYRQRAGIAQALVHRPALLLLDEPAAGLDPAQIVEMRGLLRGLKGHHTILLSSHFLSEIEQVCDRMLVMHHGRLVAEGNEDAIAKAMGHQHLLRVELAAADTAEPLLATLPGVTGTTRLPAPDGVQAFELACERDIRAEVARAVVGAGHDLLALQQDAARLESVFLALTHQDRGKA